MYLGWKKDNAALQRGADILSKKGPSKGDVYYNFFATQVMHHLEGWIAGRSGTTCCATN